MGLRVLGDFEVVDIDASPGAAKEATRMDWWGAGSGKTGTSAGRGHEALSRLKSVMCLPYFLVEYLSVNWRRDKCVQYCGLNSHCGMLSLRCLCASGRWKRRGKSRVWRETARDDAMGVVSMWVWWGGVRLP